MAEAEVNASWLPLTFYMEAHVVSGSIYHPVNLRLIDVLNQAGERQSNNADTFIEVSNAIVFHTDGIEENQQSAYLNEAAILLVGIEDGNLARGIGAGVGPKRYPFVQKFPVQVVVQMPTYMLSGYLHCCTGQVVGDVLRATTMFLPLTDVHIKTHLQNTWQAAPFAALNRKQILSLSQEKTFN